MHRTDGTTDDGLESLDQKSACAGVGDVFPLDARPDTRSAPKKHALFAQGARCNAKDGQGNSPLHYAASIGFTDLIQVLKEWGGDASLQNDRGANPVHYAMAKVSSALAPVAG